MPKTILSIETSCDETALSLLTYEKQDEGNLKIKIISNLVLSQVELHKEYGGVYPSLAKREHSKNLTPLFQELLQDAEKAKLEFSAIHIRDEKIAKAEKLLEREPLMAEALTSFFKEQREFPKIDIIAVTTGPGLEPALWVGVNFAKALSLLLNIPIIPINHMEGHILSIFATDPQTEEIEINFQKQNFPLLSLLVSGGHTDLVLIKNWLDYEILGRTLDDAIGEAFDKTARLLGLSYPGGPKISKLALLGKEDKNINLPRPMLNSADYNFSFSGIKTAVLYLVRELEKESEDNKLDEQTKADIAKEFEEAVTEVLIKKSKKAVLEYGVSELIIAGGVSANSYIRQEFEKLKNEKFPNLKLHFPQREYCGDNSLMIGLSALLHLEKDTELSNKLLSFSSPEQENKIQALRADGKLRIDTQ